MGFTMARAVFNIYIIDGEGPRQRVRASNP